jgi:hypothetical protein
MTLTSISAPGENTVDKRLCTQCERVVSSPQRAARGIWHGGPKPQRFQYAEGRATWIGAHHVEEGSFATAYKERCYLCHTIYRNTGEEGRQFLNYFRTFFEAREEGASRYSFRFAIEIPRPASRGVPPIQIVECAGKFKIMPKEGKLDQRSVCTCYFTHVSQTCRILVHA